VPVPDRGPSTPRRRFRADPDEARETGRRAREAALERYGLERFLRDWDALLDCYAR